MHNFRLKFHNVFSMLKKINSDFCICQEEEEEEEEKEEKRSTSSSNNDNNNNNNNNNDNNNNNNYIDSNDNIDIIHQLLIAATFIEAVQVIINLLLNYINGRRINK